MPIQRPRTQNDPVLRMTHMLESCAASSQDDHAALMLGMAAKALTQLQSHNDRMMAEAMDWKDKYEHMGQLFRELVGELEDEVDVLAEENGQLRVRCQECEAHLLMDGLADKDDLKCEIVPAEALSEALPIQQTTTTNTPLKSFSGDVYNQLDEFEHSLDMELDAFQRLEFLSDELQQSLDTELEEVLSVSENGTSYTRDDEHSCASCLEYNGHGISCGAESKALVQHKTLETSKGLPIEPTMNPLHLLRRAFNTQDDVTMPALTTSDSLSSLSSDCSSIQSSSSQDLLGFSPAKKMTETSPEPNAAWGIME